MAGESKGQDEKNSPKNNTKCRIPLRLPAAKMKPMSCKSKTASEATARPKSANRIRDDSYSRTSHSAPRAPRPERERYVPKKSPMPLKKMTNDGKTGKSVITIPLNKPSQKYQYYTYSSELPDQETIKKREDLDLESGLCELTLSPGGEDSIRSGEGSMTQEISWQQCLTRFEAMKNDLGERQKAIMDLYANMTQVQQQMTAMGKKVSLPSSEELTILNVAKLTPDQLLQLCSLRQADRNENEGTASLANDINKLYALPTKMIATCEETLLKRKEIIDWFDNLKSQTKAIPMQILDLKINEFKSENEMLRSSLEYAKGDFTKELYEIVKFLRDTVNEAVALQLRTEEQTYEISELNSQNKDLRKQLHNSEILRSNKNKLEELEKEIVEEKCKKNVLKDRLLKAEGQVKMGTEQALQLEEALEQSRLNICKLEHTVHELQDQKQNMEANFDRELSKLTKLIEDNTLHLEEIADSRQKLQAEKEDLEHRIEELSENYNESLKSVKHDMNIKTAKLIETENKYEEEVEQRKCLQAKVETLTKQLRENDKRSKELCAQLQEREEKLNKAINHEKELHTTRRDLHLALNDIEDFKMRLAKQSETINILKIDCEESFTTTENLKSIIRDKEGYIAKLEGKQALLEEQLQESENKMISHEQQLVSLKNHIDQLQQDFGKFESLTELHDMIREQRTKLLESTKHNEELLEALQKKEIELAVNLDKLKAQELLLTQKDGVIQMMSEKELEQTNILKLLRTNLELRAKGDKGMNQQILEKKSEIQALLSNLKTRKKQISQLEKIIQTLEEQIQKYNVQKTNYEDKIRSLEKQVAGFNDYHMDKGIDLPDNNIDNIIKIFEEELGTSFEPQLTSSSNEYMVSINKHTRENIQEHGNIEHHKISTQTRYPNELESVPTKIVMGNFVKKTYISTNDNQFKTDNLDRKKAITSIETPKCMIPNSETKTFPSSDTVKGCGYPGDFPNKTYLKNYPFILPRHLPFYNINQFRNEKNCKMFRFAGHRL